MQLTRDSSQAFLTSKQVKTRITSVGPHNFHVSGEKLFQLERSNDDVVYHSSPVYELVYASERYDGQIYIHYLTRDQIQWLLKIVK